MKPAPKPIDVSGPRRKRAHDSLTTYPAHVPNSAVIRDAPSGNSAPSSQSDAPTGA